MAFEVARALHAPLDVIVVRKLGVPFQPELAMGAIGEEGALVVDHGLVHAVGVTQKELLAVEAEQRVEVEQRVRRFRGDRPRILLKGQHVVIVDDGLATGATATAACQVARAQGASKVTVAVPVGSSESAGKLARAADEVVCLEQPDPFYAVGQSYADFAQTSDKEVVELLRKRAVELAQPGAQRKLSIPLPDGLQNDTSDDPAREVMSDSRGDPTGNHATRILDVEVLADESRLAGIFAVPPEARAAVLFAHGSGSSRYSPRNRYVADVLNQNGLATLLFDLLTPEEESTRANVFDIELLARRLTAATQWLRRQFECPDTPIGYFGASTGTAAALWAASDSQAQIGAIVSRGGRPDLAGDRLALVRAATLLIVGGNDEVVLNLNSLAAARLRCENKLEIVPGATHLFEEAGALELVATLATTWFTSHLTGKRNQTV